MDGRQAIVCAPPPVGKDRWNFVPARELDGRDGLIARTQEHFPPPEGLGLIGLDFDVKAWPQPLLDRVTEFGGLSAVLAISAPVLISAAYVRRASSSCGIRNAVSGEQTDRNGGQHRFFVASHLSQLKAFAERLHQRLVLGGFGYAFVRRTGHIEVRSLIDWRATEDVSRLWFEGKPTLSDDRLTFDPEVREPQIGLADGFLDLSALPELSSVEVAQLKVIETGLRSSVEQEAAQQRAAWCAERKRQLLARGTSAHIADKIVDRAIEHHELVGDFLILFDDGTSATVAEILVDRASFHGKTGPDPFEPEYGGGRNKAILYTDRAKARISSQAHGGINYTLTHDWFEEPVVAAVPDRAPTTYESGPADIFQHGDIAELGDVPAGSLPVTIERWVRTEARRKGAPEAFAAAAALTVIAGAIGGSLRIQVRQHDTGWTEPAGLWMALVADPGSGKSPIIGAAVSPALKLNTQHQAEWRPRHDAWKRAEAAYRRSKKELPPGAEPICKRLTLDNFTTERAIRICADNPRGLLCAPDELAGFFGQIGAYKKNGEADWSQMLRFFDGDSVTHDRMGGDKGVSAENALLSLIAGTQPNKIRSAVASLGSDGMLQRFLFVMHDGRLRRGFDEAPDQAAIDAYARLVRGLAAIEFRSGVVRLSPEAATLMAEGIERLQGVRHLFGAGSDFGGHAEKWGKFLPRIVLAFHAIREFEEHGHVDADKRVEASTVEMALRFGRFLMRHSLAFYGAFTSGSDAVADARWIAGHLLAHPDKREVDRRDLYTARKAFQGPGLPALLAAMRELETAGWVEGCEPRSADGPSKWRVTQIVHARFADQAARAKSELAEARGRIEEAGRIRRWIDGQDIVSAPPIAPIVNVFE